MHFSCCTLLYISRCFITLISLLLSIIQFKSFSLTQLTPAVITMLSECWRVKHPPRSSSHTSIPVVCVAVHHWTASSAFQTVEKKCRQMRGSRQSLLFPAKAAHSSRNRLAFLSALHGLKGVRTLGGTECTLSDAECAAWVMVWRAFLLPFFLFHSCVERFKLCLFVFLTQPAECKTSCFRHEPRNAAFTTTTTPCRVTCRCDASLSCRAGMTWISHQSHPPPCRLGT